VVVAQDEAKDGKVSVKSLLSGEQKAVAEADVVDAVKAIIAA
jgi:histidyl-tRNA synthetase